VPNKRRDAAVLAHVRVPSRPGEERTVRRRVVEAVRPLGLAPGRVEALESAVAEAVANAIEHGNDGEPTLPVEIRVAADAHAVLVRVTDQGGASGGLAPKAAPPDLGAQLRGEQPLRGWGLFLMRSLVDEVRVDREGARRIVELVMRREP
jgi:anti-sigma regulatory factor (Ser/Thr protein kinase)